MSRAIEWWAVLHGGYFLLSGVWPIVHIRSFLAVTGPKAELWLVRTVGVLITVIGATILVAAARGNLSPEVCLLAVGSAAALAAVDVFYVVNRVIPRVYLLDAAAEVVLIVGWAILYRS